MSKVYFKYQLHPGDFFRNEEITEMPNPDSNLENFLIQFLDNYQSDSRVAYIDDLSKLLYNEFLDENESIIFAQRVGNKTKDELFAAIKALENELKAEAYNNFYHLLLSNKIEIKHHCEK